MNEVVRPKPNDDQKLIVIWAVIAICISILFIVKNTSPMVLGAGFFLKFFAFLVGAVCAFIGAMIGDAIRRFTTPTAFFTSGGIMSILRTKMFWLVGPQLIGLVIGALVGIGFVLG